MAKFRATVIRDALLSELAGAPANGYTGTYLKYRLQLAGIPCATSGVYKALDALIEEGFVRRPKQPSSSDVGKLIDETLAALEHGDGRSKSVSVEVEGYTLTADGLLAAQVSLARRALAAGKPKQAEGYLLKIQRDLSHRSDPATGSPKRSPARREAS